MLRLGRWWLWTESAPDDAGRPNHNTSADVQRRKRQQDRLGVVPDEIDERAKEDNGERRARPLQVDLFEAGIAPGADHEEREQRQQRRATRPKGSTIRRGTLSLAYTMAATKRCAGGNRQSDEIFTIGPAWILGHRIGLDVETRQPYRAAEQEEEGQEIAGAVIHQESAGHDKLDAPGVRQERRERCRK